MLAEFVGQKIVVDCSSPFVCLGTLKRYDDHYLELKNADVHDLRDTETTRENYVVDSIRTGIKRNRKSVLINRREIIAIALFSDVMET
jgi:small nuclear ribonucleoprotein (snRNP)-like protein